jgi:hypothetical protein
MLCALILKTGERLRCAPSAATRILTSGHGWRMSASESLPSASCEAGCTRLVPAGCSTTKDVNVVSIAPSKMPTFCRLPHEEKRQERLHEAHETWQMQTPQGVGAHQGDSRAKRTRCVPLRTSRSSRRRHISACSPCLPPRNCLGGEDARRQTKRSFRAMTFWAWLRPYQSRLADGASCRHPGCEVYRRAVRHDDGEGAFPCILMHARPCLRGAPMPFGHRLQVRLYLLRKDV